MATEFGNKFGVIRMPGDIVSRGQGGFEPIQSSTFEIGQGIDNLGTVISKCQESIESRRAVVFGCPIHQMDQAPRLGQRSESFWY